MITVELPAFLLRSDRLQVQVGLPLLPRLPACLTCLACCKCIFTIASAKPHGQQVAFRIREGGRDEEEEEGFSRIQFRQTLQIFLQVDNWP